MYVHVPLAHALGLFSHIIIVQEPEPILLGTDSIWKGSGRKRSYCEVREEMIHITDNWGSAK